MRAFRALPAGTLTLIQLSVSDVGILAANNKREPASVGSLAARGRLLLTAGGRLLLTAGLGAGLGAGSGASSGAGSGADLGADSGVALATGFGWLIQWM